MKKPNNKQQLLKDIVTKGRTTKQDALKELSIAVNDGISHVRFFYKIGDLYYGEGTKLKYRRPGESVEQTNERWKEKYEGKTREELKALSAQGYKVLIIRSASERNQSDADRC